MDGDIKPNEYEARDFMYFADFGWWGHQFEFFKGSQFFAQFLVSLNYFQNNREDINAMENVRRIALRLIEELKIKQLKQARNHVQKFVRVFKKADPRDQTLETLLIALEQLINYLAEANQMYQMSRRNPYEV